MPKTASTEPVLPLPTDKPKKDRFTFYVEYEFGDEIRNAVMALGISFSDLATEALKIHLANLRKTENRGRPWPQRRRPKLLTSRPR